MTTMTMELTATQNQRAAGNPAYDAEFTAAFEAYYTRVFAFVYSRTRDVELSKDLVATVFERAFTKGHEVREAAAYGAWLFMIAKNIIAGHYRRTCREANHLDRAREQLRFVDGPPTPEDVLLRDERVGRLISHVSTLPRRDQELLSLKFDAELTNAEIGQVLHMTPLNVRVAIFRALKRLRSRMEAEAAA
jgi:RNA polymerase sigma-70 factor (ECF subfamily)